jgi:hypothetical protein
VRKRMKWIAIILALSAILAIGIGATVVSADTPKTNANSQTCNGNGGGFRFGGNAIDEVVTKLLVMTEDEIHALRLEGKSLVEIAATKNITEQQLVDGITEYKTAQLQSRVTSGTLTQEQVNLITQRMEQNTIQAVNRSSTGPLGGQGLCNGQQGQVGGGSCFNTSTGQGKMNRWSR